MVKVDLKCNEEYFDDSICHSVKEKDDLKGNPIVSELAKVHFEEGVKSDSNGPYRIGRIISDLDSYLNRLAKHKYLSYTLINAVFQRMIRDNFDSDFRSFHDFELWEVETIVHDLLQNYGAKVETGELPHDEAVKLFKCDIYEQIGNAVADSFEELADSVFDAEVRSRYNALCKRISQVDVVEVLTLFFKQVAPTLEAIETTKGPPAKKQKTK